MHTYHTVTFLRAAAIAAAVFVMCAVDAHALTDKGYKELHIFTKVLHLVEVNYVEPIDETDTLQGAVRGMLRALDPHSVYMPPDVYRELKVDTSGRFDGVGLEVAVRDGWITVIAPIAGSPAEAAGLQTGDQIVRIDGQSTEHVDLATAVKLMRGRRGSHVTLLIKRQGVKTPFDVDVVRGKINVPSVTHTLIDDRYGYISISAFQEDTARSFEKALKKLTKGGALGGLVIDVRRNPGGLLEEAVKVADLLLPGGVIVTTESRGKEIERFEATDDGHEPDVPMIVLVDGGSASASEILAGALRDHARAVLVGQQTFGKGSVQTVFELGDGSALKLTIARYFTPNGISIQADGIVPDIDVVRKPVAEDGDEAEGTSPSARRVREADLRGHLKRVDKPRMKQTVASGLVKRLKASGVVERNVALARAGTIDDAQKQVAIDLLKFMDTSRVSITDEAGSVPSQTKQRKGAR